MPISCAKGNKIGERITIFGVVSITHPATIKIRIMARISRFLLSINDVTVVTKVCGISNIARTWDSGKDIAIMGNITPFIFAELINILGKSRQLIVRW